ncbi:carbamoyltransferase C-terminal domain-containing protein [Streptosporangium sandarakinum]|uniref:carbamoyltransferase C-terminal domain-containing protein n=1 Tax=Streptosporangium sandarakinum TaxID=1260955 RepID=UPI0036820746
MTEQGKGQRGLPAAETPTPRRLPLPTDHFHRITGVPMVLNTSFSDREPIVETPAHALATFQASGLDALCIGDYLVVKT